MKKHYSFSHLALLSCLFLPFALSSASERGSLLTVDPSLATGASFPSEETDHTLYVASTGAQGAEGTRESPLASLQEALLERAVPLLRRSESVKIKVAPGVYREGDMIFHAYELDGEKPTGPVKETLLIIEGVGVSPEETLFAGTQPLLSRWEKVGPNRYRNQWPADMGESYVGNYFNDDTTSDTAAPHGLTAQSGDGQVSLRWSQPKDSKGSEVRYHIERVRLSDVGAPTEADWANRTTIHSVDSGEQTQEYTDEEVENTRLGRVNIYAYRIRVEKDGQSHYSNQQVVTPRGEDMPYIPYLSRRKNLLFINGERLTPVTSTSDLFPGAFYVEAGLKGTPEDGIVTVESAQNLAAGGHQVEVSNCKQFIAFTGKDNLILRNFSVKGYSNTGSSIFNNPKGVAEMLGQRGAIDIKGFREGPRRLSVENILVENVHTQHNNGIGMSFWQAHRVTGRGIDSSYNGYHGINGFGEQSIMEDLVTNYNCWRRYLTEFDRWDVAAVKVTKAHDIVWRRHTAIGNREHGLWFDISLENVLIEDCIITDNFMRGLFLEISPGPFLVRNCVIARNRSWGVLCGAAQNTILENNRIYDNHDSQIAVSSRYRKVDGEQIQSKSWTLRGNDIYTHIGMLIKQANVAKKPYEKNEFYAGWLDTLKANGNTYYQSEGDRGFSLKNGVHDGSFSQWREETSQDGDSLWQNPRTDPPTGLVAEWLFEGERIDQVLDSSIYANDGSFRPNEKYHRVPGKFGRAYHPEGSDGFGAADSAGDDSLNLKQFTMSLWIRPDVPLAQMKANHPIFLSKTVGSENSGYRFGVLDQKLNTLGIRLQGGIASGEKVELTYSEDAYGEWIHLAVTYDGKNLRIYRNGEVVADSETDINIEPAQRGLSVGSGFEGALDNVRIYNEALRPETIQELYSNDSVGRSVILPSGA